MKKRLMLIVLIGISGFTIASNGSNSENEIKKVLSESSIASKVLRQSGFFDGKGNHYVIKSRLTKSADSISSSNYSNTMDELYPPHIIACLKGKPYPKVHAIDGGAK